ncbi:MAG: TatD family hydrolase [Negativicutes bacterium]|jgi:TatD DNase family protein
MSGLFDSHAHLDDERFDTDRAAVIERARAAGMSGIINAGADMSSSRRSIDLANEHAIIYAAVGIHPHDAKLATEDDYLQLERWVITEKRVVAIGEIGLDYHYDFSPREVQQRVFIRQLQLAKRVDKPIIIHNRESHADMLEILRIHATGLRGVFHCFSGSVEMLNLLLKMDLYISVGGPVTFANAKKLLEVVKHIPIDRLLIETDCPYLTPVPYRGKRNEPVYVEFAASKIAEILELSTETVVSATTRNAQTLFNI